MGSERLSSLPDITQLISGRTGSGASFPFHMKENVRLCSQTGGFKSQLHHSGAEWPWRGERIFWSIKQGDRLALCSPYLILPSNHLFYTVLYFFFP